MKYVEAIEELDSLRMGVTPCDWARPWIFLAGGITDCPDWQDKVRRLIRSSTQGTLLNPRRKNFPIGNPDAALEQITWEFHALNRSDVFSMWFSAGSSVQPICMYELGRHLARWQIFNLQAPGSAKPMNVCIGVEPGYKREQDVRIQTSLICEGLKIADSLMEHTLNIMACAEAYLAGKVIDTPNLGM